ncbi:MAG TPA: hypothetical protein PL185_12190 [Flavobacteriales bacterium]|nr:hypothetical protein [Flavobacteriales bacterium]HPH83330.1 hypothetical protein [Flavobacteriales bacterium]
MKTYQIDVLNPKAVKLLQDLADLNLISIRKTDENLSIVLKRLRKKASINTPSIEEITQEVELVREKRNASKKR